MEQLKTIASEISSQNKGLPFSIYTSKEDQHLLNVPVIQPLLICVLGGSKELGQHHQQICGVGDFVFLSNTPQINMRNISQQNDYFALLVEFSYEDFDIFKQRPVQKTSSWFTGKTTDVLNKTLLQFIQWADYAPEELWSSRRREILQLMYHIGYKQVASIAEPPSLTHKVERILSANLSPDVGLETVARELAMGESTLRRKLSEENTHFQVIKDRIRLGAGLHLLQTTQLPIGLVAEQTGFTSQSRFTDKFKSLFGLTPSELRKTRGVANN